MGKKNKICHFNKETTWTNFKWFISVLGVLFIHINWGIFNYFYFCIPIVNYFKAISDQSHYNMFLVKKKKNEKRNLCTLAVSSENKQGFYKVQVKTFFLKVVKLHSGCCKPVNK